MIPKYISKNFEVLQKAFDNNAACIMEVKDVKTKKKEYLICIHQHEPNASDGRTEEFIPVARIFKYTKNDIPFELYNPPIDDRKEEN